MYAHTLKTIVHLLDTLDDGRDEIEDAGIRLEYINLTTPDNEGLIGQIQFDDDGHPFFSPEYDPSFDLIDTVF